MEEFARPLPGKAGEKGEKMKSLDVKLTVIETKKNGTVVSSLNAELLITDDLKISAILSFFDDVRNIWKKAMMAVKKCNFMEMEVLESSYDNWMTDKELVQKSFNRWVSVPIEKQDAEGIYLIPDERYTTPNRDMYLSKDLLNDLSFTLG